MRGREKQLKKFVEWCKVLCVLIFLWKRQSQKVRTERELKVQLISPPLTLVFYLRRKKQKLNCLQVKKITLVFSFLFKCHLELKHHGLIEETVTTAGSGHSEHLEVLGVKTPIFLQEKWIIKQEMKEKDRKVQDFVLAPPVTPCSLQSDTGAALTFLSILVLPLVLPCVNIDLTILSQKKSWWLICIIQYNYNNVVLPLGESYSCSRSISYTELGVEIGTLLLGDNLII